MSTKKQGLWNDKIEKFIENSDEEIALEIEGFNTGAIEALVFMLVSQWKIEITS